MQDLLVSIASRDFKQFKKLAVVEETCRDLKFSLSIEGNVSFVGEEEKLPSSEGAKCGNLWPKLCAYLVKKLPYL